jgi:hypothetical protein
MLLLPNPLWLDFVYAFIFLSLGWFATQIGEWFAEKITPHTDGPATVRLGITPAIAIAFATAFMGFRFSAHGTAIFSMIFIALVICTLIIACWTDLRTGQVPVVVILPVILLVFGVDIFNKDWASVGSGILLASPFAITAFLSKGRGIGWGDVEIVALGGVVLGLNLGILAFSAACFLSVGVTFLRKKMKEPIAFIPYLTVVIAIAMLIPTLVA